MTPKPGKEVSRLLLDLLQGQRITKGMFKSASSRQWLDMLLDEGVLIKLKSGKTFIIRPSTPNSIQNYLKSIGINDLRQYYQILQQSSASRQEMVKAASDSKLRKTNVLSGFFIRSLGKIDIKYNGNKLKTDSDDGLFIFVKDWQKLELAPNITVVGIENFEPFAGANNYACLLPDNSLLVYAQNRKTLVSWLRTIPNPYLHFGDFDLSGIAIYVTQFKQQLPGQKTSFLVPPNIEQLIERFGNQDLYFNQLTDPNVKSVNPAQHPEIKQLWQTIHRLRKGLEQEGVDCKTNNLKSINMELCR